jgi:hypothetical protein
MGVRSRVEILKMERSGIVVAQCGVLKGISGSLDGKNGDEGVREKVAQHGK